MYWTGFVSGAIAAYALPVVVAVVMICWESFIDWRNKSPRSLDPYSRSIEDHVSTEDESVWHDGRYRLGRYKKPVD